MSKSEITEVRSDSVLALLFVHLKYVLVILTTSMVEHNLAGVSF